MSLTIQQILLDSERLATRLKEDDSAADVLLSQTQTVYKQIDAMKQYAEETGELNELARQRPHSVLVAGIQQESRNLRELRQENRELRAALEEHQNALEVIMSKYRQQITHLVQVSKLNLTNMYNSQYTQVIRRQAEKMNEMAAVMKMAAEIDEKNATQGKEVLSRLTTENQGLRELLGISTKFGSLQVKSDEDNKDGKGLKNGEEKISTKNHVNADTKDDSDDDDDDDDGDDRSDKNIEIIKFDDKTVIRKDKKNDKKNKQNNNISNNNSTTTVAPSALLSTNVTSELPGTTNLLQNSSSTCTTAINTPTTMTTTTTTTTSITKDMTAKK
ncbi:FGFR1 oncogene partner 2 homolog [Lycorma delicatula]|uniref:FGFR1 oncogene partner 2 homolog n=1 Tax=Lycorma delicatula TaxID=130591 RepID=UPI003F50D7DA